MEIEKNIVINERGSFAINPLGGEKEHKNADGNASPDKPQDNGKEN